MNYKGDGGYEVVYPSTTISQVSSLQNQLNSKLNLSGGTMTGNLILNANPTSAMQATTKQYVDNLKWQGVDGEWVTLVSNQSIDGSTGQYSSSVDTIVDIDPTNYTEFIVEYDIKDLVFTANNRSTYFCLGGIATPTPICKVPNNGYWYNHYCLKGACYYRYISDYFGDLQDRNVSEETKDYKRFYALFGGDSSYPTDGGNDDELYAGSGGIYSSGSAEKITRIYFSQESNGYGLMFTISGSSTITVRGKRNLFI